MVKVLSAIPHPTTTKEVICRRCGSLLEYTPNDVKSKYVKDYGGGGDTEYTIDCPTCANHIHVPTVYRRKGFIMNCSAGDLAHIIKSVDGLMVGRSVQCISLDLPNHSVLGPIWNVRSNDDLVSEYGSVGKTIHVPDAWLKKIKPPPLPNKVKQKELTE